jgi:hypothetical protein
MGRKSRSKSNNAATRAAEARIPATRVGPAAPDVVASRRVAGVMQRLNVGQSFAEYDHALDDQSVFVHTPAFNAALDPQSGKFFFVGRRGTGKTALRTYCELYGSQARVLIPEIFSPASAVFDLQQFENPKAGPFRGLVSAFKRALLGEILLLWRQQHTTYADLSPAISDELADQCSMDFDERAIRAIEDIAVAVEAGDDLLLIAQNKAVKSLAEEMKRLQSRGSYTILVDSIDDVWDGSDQALTYLTAFMHACLEVSTQIPWARALLFLRENIFERVRARDSESSRVETAIAGLDWTHRLLLEMVERRLNRPLTAKFQLGGPTWDAFFENPSVARERIFEYCLNRPRDVLIHVSHAIDLAKERGHSTILLEDVEGARRRFSDNRLKDLGDEYAENYPQIALVLAKFYGLGRRFTPVGMESLIRTIISDSEVQKLCSPWIFENQALESFTRLLYNIGFLGLERPGRSVKYRALGPQDTSPPALTSDITLVVHKCYWDALDLQDALISEIPRTMEIGRIGVVFDLPDGLDPSSYAENLENLDQRLRSTPMGGGKAATDFEDIVGDILRLCFFRGLNNIEARVRDADGVVVRDWIASIRTEIGFWNVIRQRYNATQVVWECKNYADLTAEDFQQISYYMTEPLGRFVVVAFRGEMSPTSPYMRHIKRMALERNGMVLPLGIKDLNVFIRQARNGRMKEDHIQDRYDAIVRKIA